MFITDLIEMFNVVGNSKHGVIVFSAAFWMFSWLVEGDIRTEIGFFLMLLARI